MKHPQAAHYHRLDFDPSMAPGHNGQVWNMWQGFAYEPLPGGWPRLQEHLFENICDKRDDLYDWLMNWFALGVQKPADLIGTAVVMRGAPGVGKGVVANAYGALWSSHYTTVTHATHVNGRFNAHLAAKRLVFVDEGLFGGNRKEAGVIKTRVTEPYVILEQKGVDPIKMRNRALMMIASNEDSIVPADLGDQRWMVLDVATHRKEDLAYFGAIATEMASGDYEAMMYDLLRRDISKGPNPRLTIKTEALFDQVLRAQPPYVQYLHLILDQARLPQNFVAGADTTTIRALTEELRARHPTERYLNPVALGRLINKVIPAVLTDPNGVFIVCILGKESAVKETSTEYRFPAVPKARAAFERFIGMPVPWSNTLDEWQEDPAVEEGGEGGSPYRNDPSFDGI